MILNADRELSQDPPQLSSLETDFHKQAGPSRDRLYSSTWNIAATASPKRQCAVSWTERCATYLKTLELTKYLGSTHEARISKTLSHRQSYTIDMARKLVSIVWGGYPLSSL